MVINLYDYQKNVLESCKSNPSHSQLISMPTVTGKTITFLSLAKELNKKTLILVHREELLRQTYEKAKLCGFEERNVAIISAEKKDKPSLINIAMVQTLSRNLEKYSPEDIEMIIVDEAHHACANSYTSIFKHFKIFEEKKYIFGFTATPLRGDKEQLSNIFHVHSFKMTLSEATQLGYIVPVNGIRIEIDKSLSEIDFSHGDYDITQLDKIMNCESVNNIVVEKCLNLKKVPAIIFTTSVDHAKNIARMLREKGRKAISVSYQTSKRTLSQIFKMLERGSIDFITNAVKLSEGFDYPALRGVILARPTRSPVLYKQMIGRGLRNYPDKYDCYVLEFTSNDPKMMKWEDIDANSTFQSTSKNQRISYEQAKKHYISLYNNSSRISVIDVRISPFEFYECKIRRTENHKNFMYTPFTEGFAVYEIRENRADKKYEVLFDLYATIFFWSKEYESFYVWDAPNVLMTTGGPRSKKDLILGPKFFAEANRFAKWYPSDIQKVSRQQKILMKKFGVNYKYGSARKAEIEIEDACIKKAIDQFISKHHFSGIMKII